MSISAYIFEKYFKPYRKAVSEPEPILTNNDLTKLLLRDRVAAMDLVFDLTEYEIGDLIWSLMQAVVNGSINTVFTKIDEYKKIAEARKTATKIHAETKERQKNIDNKIIRKLENDVSKAPRVNFNSPEANLKEIKKKIIKWDLDFKNNFPYIEARKAFRKKSGSLVYFIAIGQYIKIGYTANSGNRYSSISHLSPIEPQVLGWMEFETLEDAKKEERRLHTLFLNHRVRGEFFQLESHLIKDILKDHICYM